MHGNLLGVRYILFCYLRKGAMQEFLDSANGGIIFYIQIFFFQNRGTSIIYVQGAEIFLGATFLPQTGGRFCGLWPGGGIFSNRT